MKKVKVNCTVKLNAYSIIDDAIENAINAGYRRAHKHGKPDEQQLIQDIHHTVMLSISELLVFDN